MPRLRVIILEQDDTRTFRYVLWADVPTTRQSFYANALATSAWKDATAGDILALQAGQVAERTGTLGVEAGTSLAQARAQLQATWQSFQDRVTAVNPWVRYGSVWDGTTWTAAGVN